MAKEEKEVKVEEPKSPEIELVETVKESGIGLRMPEGNLLDVSDVSSGQAQWMAWVTQTLNEIKRNIA